VVHAEPFKHLDLVGHELGRVRQPALDAEFVHRHRRAVLAAVVRRRAA